MSKVSKAGAKHVKKMKKAAKCLLRDQTVREGLASWSLPAGPSPLSRLRLETDPAAAALREAWLKEKERCRREQWPAERKKLLAAAQRAEDARKKVLLRRSS